MSSEIEQSPFQYIDTEHQQTTEVQPIDISEDTTVINALRQRITAWNLDRAVSKLKELETHDEVMKHNPVEAQELRGFGSSAPEPDTRPIGFMQKLSYRHRQKQVEKKRKHQIELHRIAQVYGQPANSEISPTIYRSSKITPAAERWNKAATKLEKIDRGVEFSFDLDKRMSKREHRSERKAQERNQASMVKIGQIDKKLIRGARGETLPAEIRSRRISRQKEKIERLNTKRDYYRANVQNGHEETDKKNPPNYKRDTNSPKTLSRLRKLAKRKDGPRKRDTPKTVLSRTYHVKPPITKWGQRYQAQQAINRRGVI